MVIRLLNNNPRDLVHLFKAIDPGARRPVQYHSGHLMGALLLRGLSPVWGMYLQHLVPPSVHGPTPRSQAAIAAKLYDACTHIGSADIVVAQTIYSHEPKKV